MIEIEVFAGITNLNGPYAYQAIVSKIDTLQHQSYDRNTLHNDIGLVCLRQPIPRTPSMRPIALPSRRSNPRGQSRSIIGFGISSDGEI